MEIPCKDCITISICMNERDDLSPIGFGAHITKKCSLAKEYVNQGTIRGELAVHRVLKIYRFLKKSKGAEKYGTSV